MSTPVVCPSCGRVLATLLVPDARRAERVQRKHEVQTSCGQTPPQTIWLLRKEDHL